MMKLSLLVLFLIARGSFAPPVAKNNTTTHMKENEIEPPETGLEDYMDYHRYLKEVVDILESDPQFREKLEKAQESDIRSGKIAQELEYVNHKVRSRLDEIKRAELERLRHLANKQYEIENGLNGSMGKVGAAHPDKEHIDHSNPHTFEIEDLKKLIAKSTQDLAEADRKRRQEFKEYEMQKEFERQEKLKTLDDVQRTELEKQLKEQEFRHKKHVPLHHPGSKQQLEEVWEKQDHMEQQNFNPKTFFMLHDLDGNGMWDEDEVKTLFVKELDKMYSEGAPEDDMRERIEEMERMREHVFQEVDKNKDGLISYEEFLDQTKKQDFQEDKGWESLDQQKLYTDDEYKQFEKKRMEEIERLIAQGMLPPHPGAPVYHDPRMAQPHQFPSQGHHPGQMPPMYPQHPGQAPPYGQMPPGQYHGQYYPHQMPPQHYQPGQMPPQPQYHPGQIPPQQQQQLQHQQQFQQQQPMNNQLHSNQIPRQGNLIGQEQNNNNQLPPLNTNEVYVNQGQVNPQAPVDSQQQQPVQNQINTQQQPPVEPVQEQQNLVNNNQRPPVQNQANNKEPHQKTGSDDVPKVQQV